MFHWTVASWCCSSTVVILCLIFVSSLVFMFDFFEGIEGDLWLYHCVISGVFVLVLLTNSIMAGCFAAPVPGIKAIVHVFVAPPLW